MSERRDDGFRMRGVRRGLPGAVGSRHGQAFAAFALQHPVGYATSLDRAWEALYRIDVDGERPAMVFGALREGGAGRTRRDVPARPPLPRGMPTMTIADLADFSAETYAAHLDAWCRAALAAWSGVAAADPQR